MRVKTNGFGDVVYATATIFISALSVLEGYMSAIVYCDETKKSSNRKVKIVCGWQPFLKKKPYPA